MYFRREDCNIICGNSLIDEFKGNKPIAESVLLHDVSEDSQQTIFRQGVDGIGKTSLLNAINARKGRQPNSG